MLVGLTAAVTIGQQPGDKPPDKNSSNELKPSWAVGDSWTVRATAIQSQASTEANDPQQQSAPVDWQFTVTGTDKIKERFCYRVSVVCLEAGRQHPATTLWLDADSRTLTRVESKIMVKGQWRTFTETYITADGKPTPVLGPLPALPLDFPVIAVDGTTKSLAGQTYQTIYGDTGIKALGDVGFAFAVDQSVTPVDAKFVKSLAPQSEAEDVTKVELRGAGRTISQLWHAGDPWPIYSNNGMTEARLMEVKRADANAEGF
jgi:hypothetical protein